MNITTILQISDPHGIIITVASVLVVFVCLAILHISYGLIGKIIYWYAEWSAKKDGTTIPTTKGQNSPHDEESYMITIRRKGKNETIKAHKSAIMMQDRPKKETAISNHIVSPLYGNILAVNVKIGDKVKAGQTVAVLEAMKMENEILAEAEGTVTVISVQKDDHVVLGDHILTIE